MLDNMSVENMLIGFIGSGRMMQAISNGSINSGLTKAENIIASDRDNVTLDSLKKLGVQTCRSNKEVVSKSDLIIIAVKPGVVPHVLNEVKDTVTGDKLIVSVAAGVTLKSIEEVLPKGTRVIRVMPNTPALVQMGAAFIAPGSSIKSGDLDIVSNIFNSVGISEVGPEELINAVTGLSGSGPAYVFAAIEAMADGGVKMGLPRKTSLRLAAQTFMGAAKMVLETDKHPGELKDAVCSPGGTCIAGMHKLESAGFRGAIIDAVEAATLRANELGNKKH